MCIRGGKRGFDFYDKQELWDVTEGPPRSLTIDSDIFECALSEREYSVPRDAIPLHGCSLPENAMQSTSHQGKRGPGHPRLHPHRQSLGGPGRPRGRRDSYSRLKRGSWAAISKEALKAEIRKRKTLADETEEANVKERSKLDVDVVDVTM